MKVSEPRVTLSDGTPITMRAILPIELDRIVLRCRPDRRTLERLFAEQGTIGFAAWDGGQLRVVPAGIVAWLRSDEHRWKCHRPEPVSRPRPYRRDTRRLAECHRLSPRG